MRCKLKIAKFNQTLTLENPIKTMKDLTGTNNQLQSANAASIPIDGDIEQKPDEQGDDGIDWSKYVDTTWDLHSNDGEYVLNRLTGAYEVTASLAGFIGGFTFIVGSSEISFDKDETGATGGDAISPATRRELYGLLVTLAFTSALVASMLASSYYVLVNICGVKKSKHFVKEFYFEKNCLGCGKSYIAWTNVPWYLMNFSVFLLLVAVIVSVGGLYVTAVFVPNLLYLLFVVGLGMYMFNVMWARMRSPDFGLLKTR